MAQSVGGLAVSQLFDVKGVVIVTGGSSGIGTMIASAFVWRLLSLVFDAAVKSY